MHVKASKVKDINDYIDCVLFNLKYISIDSNDVVSRHNKNFGLSVSAVPLMLSYMVLESGNNLAYLDQALSCCNPSILQFNHDISLADLDKYKDSYKIWLLAKDVNRAIEYLHLVDAFVVDFSDLSKFAKSAPFKNKKIIVRVADRSQVEHVKDIDTDDNIVVDINYYRKDIYDFEKNYDSDIMLAS